MSTDHQECSIEIQSAAIALYAASHNMGIVRSYVDAGKSGLTIAGREGLKQLIQTVTKHKADFEVILVYDVSRWGRFQDVDESAHYEFLCKRAGIQVCYCAELFENDNSPTSNLLKSLKRLMAGEYSRELSSKVFIAQCRLASQGYKQGGPAPYGVRRQVISKNGAKRQTLEWGEQKSIATDRVIFVPGPEEEISNVRYIFDSLTKRKNRVFQICTDLNKLGRSYRGRPWTNGTIRELLRNPVFTGRFVFLRYRDGSTSRSMLNPHLNRNRIVIEGALPRVISDRQFKEAQRLLRERMERRRPSREKLLENLRALLRRKGRLCVRLIRNEPGVNGVPLYAKRFGSVTEAYRLIGYSEKGFSYMPIERRRQIRRDILNDLVSRIMAVGGVAAKLPKRRDVLLVNGQLTVSLRFSVPRIWRKNVRIWTLSIHQNAPVDLQIIVRLNPESSSGIVDYFVIPRLADIKGIYHVKADRIPAFIDVYRTDDLSSLLSAMGCSQVLGIA